MAIKSQAKLTHGAFAVSIFSLPYCRFLFLLRSASFALSHRVVGVLRRAYGHFRERFNVHSFPSAFDASSGLLVVVLCFLLLFRAGILLLSLLLIHHPTIEKMVGCINK